MPQRKVGDFLTRMKAPELHQVTAGVGAAPIDKARIIAEAGVSDDHEANLPKKSEELKHKIDPLLVKELEVISLKIKLAEMEEQLLIQRVQETRARRKELLLIQQRLAVQAKSQIVRENGVPQVAPE